MNISIDKSKYFKFWQQVNPTNDIFIRTSKTMKWIKALIHYEDQLIMKQKMRREDKKNNSRKDRKEVNEENKNIEKKQLTKNKSQSNQ